MKIPRVVTMITALLLSGSTAFGAGLVEKADLRNLIRVEYHEDGPGKVSGIVHNQSSKEVKDIVLMVRHDWVWPYAGNDQPDTYGRTEYVSVDRELVPGMAAAFASVVSPSGDVPGTATYSSNVEVHSVTEMVDCCDAPVRP
jgi:hypothetical protein